VPAKEKRIREDQWIIHSKKTTGGKKVKKKRTGFCEGRGNVRTPLRLRRGFWSEIEKMIKKKRPAGDH